MHNRNYACRLGGVYGGASRLSGPAAAGMKDHETENTMYRDDDRRGEGSFADPQFDSPAFLPAGSLPDPEVAATPTDQVRKAVLAFDPGQRLRPERIRRLLADQGIDAPIDQVRGALAGL